MLYEFLGQYKKEIIQLCKDKVLADSDSRPTTALLDKGLPVFYDELIGVLKRTAALGSPEQVLFNNKIREGDAAEHGKESLRLGYTISQVVHSYGAVCQAITQFVQTKSYTVTSREFEDLNLSLDCAIAEAVTEYEKLQSDKVSDLEDARLAVLMHEMGNALVAAIAAHEMIQKGRVGSAGVTSEILSRSHERMQHLIRNAETEIRLSGNAALKQTQVRLVDITREANAMAIVSQKSKDVHLKFDVGTSINLTVDKHLLFSALTNLVNNAIKYTNKHGTVSVRGTESKGRILIEVEDECGGLTDGKTEELFKPFVQKGARKTRNSLGLSISRQAVELNRGTLTARNIPKKGCVFTINLPKDGNS